MSKIDKKIVSYKVKTNLMVVEPSGLTESHERPEVLTGKSYKIKPPTGAAVYITINDIELEGVKYPYELFIATKDVAHYQWVAAMSRLISAVLRKGGDVAFIAEELKVIHDPVGSYFVKGHGLMPGIVAHIGHVLETHLKELGK